MAAASYSHHLQDLGGKHEGRDDEGNEDLTRDERGHERDAHGELHRHAPSEQVLDGFAQHRPRPDRQGDGAEDLEVQDGRRREEPGDDGRQADADDPSQVDEPDVVLLDLLFERFGRIL